MKLTALYVDNDRSSFVAWGRPLETRFGWHVDYAENAEQALELMKRVEFDYDAAVLDRMMPDPKRDGSEHVGVGDELLREIVTRYPDCCVVMFTNIANVTAAQRNARRGAYAFLTKGQETVDDLDRALRNGVAAKRVDRLCDLMSLESRKQPLSFLVEELANILRALYRSLERPNPLQEPSQLQAYYIPISPGGSPLSPEIENVTSPSEWLPRDPVGLTDLLSDTQRVVANFAGDLLNEWTATRDFKVQHQVLLPVRTRRLAMKGRGEERVVRGVICLESDRRDMLREEQIDIAERVARAMSLAIEAQLQAEYAHAEGERTAERDLHAEFAHRVRNPLQTAQLTLERLATHLEGGSVDSTLVLTMIGRLSKALQTAIEATLSFRERSQPNERRMVDVDLAKILRELVSDFPESQREAIHLDLPSNLTLIKGEPGELKYAFRCLVDNSLDALFAVGLAEGQERHIEISVEPDPTGKRDVRISVIDNGCGFPSESVDRIFDRGYSTKARVDGHTGLGLWEVKRIVNAHGGEVEAAPAPKGGAYISVLLPLISARDPVFQ